jgi:hypothetical protein
MAVAVEFHEQLLDQARHLIRLDRDAAAMPLHGRVFHLQAVFLGAGGSSRLSHPVGLLVLDHAVP